jgi:hypothetical protein
LVALSVQGGRSSGLLAIEITGKTMLLTLAAGRDGTVLGTERAAAPWVSASEDGRKEGPARTETLFRVTSEEGWMLDTV